LEKAILIATYLANKLPSTVFVINYPLVLSTYNSLTFHLEYLGVSHLYIFTNNKGKN